MVSRALLLALCLGGCSAFGAADGEPPVAQPDGGDGGDGGDGASTEGGAPPLPGQSFCASLATDGTVAFCEDFEGEDPSSPSSGWEAQGDAPGTRAIGAAPGRAGQALRLVLDEEARPGRGFRFSRPVSIDPSKGASIEADIHLVDNSLQYVGLVDLFMIGPGVGVLVGAGATSLELCRGEDGTRRRPVASNQWARVRAEFIWNGNEVVETLAVDDEIVFANLAYEADVPSADKRLVRIGAFDTSPNEGRIEVWIDNVVVRTK